MREKGLCWSVLERWSGEFSFDFTFLVFSALRSCSRRASTPRARTHSHTVHTVCVVAHLSSTRGRALRPPSLGPPMPCEPERSGVALARTRPSTGSHAHTQELLQPLIIPNIPLYILSLFYQITTPLVPLPRTREDHIPGYTPSY